MPSRRVFLQNGVATVLAMPTVPALLEAAVVKSAHPLDTRYVPQLRETSDNVLVVVQLAGGNDGLNTVVPFADDVYHRVRPDIRHEAKTLHKLNDSLGLHPNLGPLMDLYQRGNMAVVQAVGYPNPDRSHFRATDIWHSAQPEREQASSGWVGRYFDNTCVGADPQVGINIGATLPLAMQGERVMPLTLERPEHYPRGELGDGLRLTAAMIRGGLSTRVYYVHLGGFDTHTNQRGRHDRLMQVFADAVGAFWADLEEHEHDQRVMMMTFSEFGRRVAQNASGGTDHGAAAPVLLFGPRVEGGIYGDNPSLTDLDNGDLKHQVDFRSVYATLLQQWLDTTSEPVLGRQFKLLPVLRV